MATDVHALPYEDDGEATGPGWWELASLTVLVVASIGVPIVGWLVGLSLVLLSDVWTARDKAIAIAGPLWVVVGLVAWTALGGPSVLGMSATAVLFFLGGAVAGVCGAGYLTVRAFVLA